MEIKATVIADTMGLAGARITTFEVVAPRFLLAEVNTHRVVARSAASSRAIPVMKRVEMAQRFPFVPRELGRNRPGMQATEALSEEERAQAMAIWADATEDAIEHATRLAKVNAHKQHANRVLEPYAWYSGVMTATEWDWFFKLRKHPDAQPEFQELAAAMWEARQASAPKYVGRGGWHLPYLSDAEAEQLAEYADEVGIENAFFAVSAARCARVSYKTFDGKVSSLEDDMALCRRLMEQGHLSPFDHPSTADTLVIDGEGAYRWMAPAEHRHLWGWVPRRVAIERVLGVTPCRDSFAPISMEDSQ